MNELWERVIKELHVAAAGTDRLIIPIIIERIPVPDLPLELEQIQSTRLTNPPTISRRNLLKWADDGTRRS